jgi:hypothetical protein
MSYLFKILFVMISGAVVGAVAGVGVHKYKVSYF